MDLSTEKTDGTFTAHLSGQLKYQDNAVFRKLIEEVNESGAKQCVLDMRGLTSIDSAGLGMLVIACDNADSHGWKIALHGVKGQVRKILDLSRFDKIMPVVPDPSGE